MNLGRTRRRFVLVYVVVSTDNILNIMNIQNLMQNVLGVFKQFGHYSVGKRYIYPFPVKNFECLPSIKYAGLLSTATYPPPPHFCTIDWPE